MGAVVELDEEEAIAHLAVGPEFFVDKAGGFQLGGEPGEVIGAKAGEIG